MHVPFPVPALVFIPLAGLLYVSAREPTPRLAARAALVGWLGFWAVHLFWLPQSFAPSFGVAVWALMPLVWVIEAGFNALLTWAVRAVCPRPLAFLGAMTGALVLLEWARGLGPLAFPWGNFGYALVDSPFAQVASLGGVYLGSILVVFAASSLAALLFYEWRWLGIAALLCGAGAVYGVTRPAPATPTRQAWLLQGNINSFSRFRGDNRSDLEIFTSLLKGAPRDAVVALPEAALELNVVANVEPQLVNALQFPAVPKLIAGVADLRQGARLNSVAAIQNRRLLMTTDKTYLVPFGEYFPLLNEAAPVYRFVFGLFGIGMLESAEPSRAQRLLELGGERFGAFVCYDSIFPSLPRILVARGAQVLVEPTNDGWFGGGAGNEQHFAMDRVRAIETGRYLLRVANTGITAGVDPLGRVLEHLPQNVQGALLTRYAPLETRTAYVVLGDWALLLALGGVIVAVLGGRPRARW
jgi:apolipoprotein N-acyltransferase